MIVINNYHKHTSYSNIWGLRDSAASYEDYAKRAVELGHKVISSVEHGFQGYYYETYELAQKYDLKFIFGAEAYWVKDRFEKARGNNHIILLAKNENGRQAINDVLSEANETGYYFRPRLDLELLLSLPATDVMITTACVAFWNYDDTEEILKKLHCHFGNNLYLEIQYHATEKQIELNKRILQLSEKYGIEMIAGMDSHYIYPEQSAERDYMISTNNVHFDDEVGWFMDYPDDETTMNRFLAQNIFSKEQIQRAMDNTDVLLTFEDYAKDNPVFSKDVKLPTLYDGEHIVDGKALPKLDQQGRNKVYSKLITKKFKEYMKTIPEEKWDEYYEGVKTEVQTIKETNMSDYFLIDYEIVKLALQRGGILTNTGRGSSVGYFTNTLLGFSKVDRFTSPIKLYPERFISKSRILESKSLPDIDMNWGTPEIAEEAQRDILGKDHAYPMIAFGTAKKKSAFKLYARSQNMDFDLANAISAQIEKYDEALKYADDDERDEINIYDYVDAEYHSYIDASQKYWGIIMDKKKAPCSYLLYSGNIRREIGLIKCKSDTTKKEYITTVVDGAIAENYKFLKNDILKVDVSLLTDMVYKRIGIPTHSVTELIQISENNQKVWDIYAKGLTMGVNQCEKESTARKAMAYKPKNIAELSSFIAAIRPGFKSMYKIFENREDFSYDIPVFDNLLRTKEMPVSFMIFQEQVMQVLNFAGFPIDQCYSIIKNIAKKHPEKVRPLKSQFLKGFAEQIIENDGIDEQDAKQIAECMWENVETSPCVSYTHLASVYAAENIEKTKESCEKVWQVINDNCSYSFNSAHAYCMGLDSLYQAWQKSNHPYEFYEVLLQTYSDKGKKDKVAELKKEMLRGFGIAEGKYAFGSDNRKFVADPENHVIYPSLLSIKGLSQGCANDLYDIAKKNNYTDYYSVWKAMKSKKSLNSAKIQTLIEIGYFSKFGSIGKIQNFMKAIDELYDRSQFSKDSVPVEYFSVIKKYSEETEKQYRKFDFDSALNEIWNELDDSDISLQKKLNYELDNLGYIQTIIPELSQDYYFVQDYECKFTNPKLTLYRLCDGDISVVKVKRKKYDEAPIKVGDMIKVVEKKKEGKWSKDADGDWHQDNEDKEVVLKKWAFVKQK